MVKESRKWLRVMYLCLAGILASVAFVLTAVHLGYSVDNPPAWLTWPVTLVLLPSLIGGRYAYARFTTALRDEHKRKRTDV